MTLGRDGRLQSHALSLVAEICCNIYTLPQLKHTVSGVTASVLYAHVAIAVLRWRIPAGSGMVQWVTTSMIKIWLSDLYSSIGLYYL